MKLLAIYWLVRRPVCPGCGGLGRRQGRDGSGLVEYRCLRCGRRYVVAPRVGEGAAVGG